MLNTGYIDLEINDWFNRINGDNYNKLLKDHKEVEYIHIGPHRTGTKFLQHNIFPYYYKSKKIFSDDVICGRLFDNGLDHAEKIYNLFPKAKIIAVIRSQPSIINSVFRTYIKAGGTWNFKNYAKKIIEIRKYDYEELLSKYFQYFGKENCLVLLYEDLLNTPKEFISSLLSFIEIKHPQKHHIEILSPGPTNIYNELIRWSNICTRLIFGSSGYLGLDSGQSVQKNSLGERIRYFCYSKGNSIDKWVIRKIFNKDILKLQFRYNSIENEIIAAYAESNRNLEKILQRDLKIYKYP